MKKTRIGTATQSWIALSTGSVAAIVVVDLDSDDGICFRVHKKLED